MSTNGHTAAPGRDQIILTATYYAAVEGYYDTSEAAQRANLLSISVMDMANIPNEVLPPGATHKFYVMINGTGHIVTRYADESYQVEPHDQIEKQSQERELREAVLDAALWHCTGEGAGYRVGAGAEARAAAIKELLAEGPEDQEPPAREESDPIPHPVIREVEPDLSISLAPGSEDEVGPHPVRQWVVEIGPYNSCEVLFFGYNEDNAPELITQEYEPEEEEDEYEDGEL